MTNNGSRTRYAAMLRKGDMPFTARGEAVHATAEDATESLTAVPADFCDELPTDQRAELWAGFTAGTWIQVWSYGPRRTDRGMRYQWHPLNLR